jgi:hypothetical protein
LSSDHLLNFTGFTKTLTKRIHHDPVNIGRPPVSLNQYIFSPSFLHFFKATLAAVNNHPEKGWLDGDPKRVGICA